MSRYGKLSAAIRRFDYQKYGPIIALVVLIAVSSIASSHFLSFGNIKNILRQVSFTGIIALGMTFVIIGGGIDLSVGSMVALTGGAVILALNWFMNSFGNGYESTAILMACLTGLAVGAAAGGINGLVVTRGKVAPFIATLGTMAIFRSLTLYIAGAGVFRSESDLFQQLGMGNLLGIPTPVCCFLALAVIFTVVLNHTRLGRYTCAVGANQKVAKYSAIRVDLVRFLSYVLVGLTVGISSVLMASRMNSINSTNVGTGFELDAIAAVVIGGTPMAGGKGSVWGTVIGAIILGIINNMLNMLGVSPYLQGTVKGLVIIGAVLIQRQKSQ
jgi:ribose transport system permease protein